MVFISPYLSNSLQDKSVPLIAKYAYGLDYHYIVKSRLNRLCNFISQDISDFSFRVFTDSAPIFERSMAVKAGLGFIGKNSMFISKSCGIHNFIGVVISNIEPLSAFKEIEDVTSTSICGTCKRCIEACPTGAIIAPFTIDANMCISYKTIEYRGDDKIGYTNNRLFGCDICIDICPWSRKSSRFVWEEFMPIKLESGEYITSLSYENWMKMSVGYFKKSFKSSPIYRAGLKKIKKVLFEQSKYEKRKKGE
jgi:epoxyqueuosine reductase